MSNIDDIDYTLNLLAQKRITDRKNRLIINGILPGLLWVYCYFAHKLEDEKNY